MALSDEEKEAIAYHEARPRRRAPTCSRARRPAAQGDDPARRAWRSASPSSSPTEERHIYTPGLHRGLARRCRMGGRVAEELVFGVVSTGRQQRPRAAPPSWPARWSASGACRDRIGPMAWGSQGAVFLGEDLMHTRDYSDETARVIDEEVERILRRGAGALPRRPHRQPPRPRPRGPGAARARDPRRHRGDPPAGAGPDRHRPRRTPTTWPPPAPRRAAARTVWVGRPASPTPISHPRSDRRSSGGSGRVSRTRWARRRSRRRGSGSPGASCPARGPRPPRPTGRWR